MVMEWRSVDSREYAADESLWMVDSGRDEANKMANCRRNGHAPSGDAIFAAVDDDNDDVTATSGCTWDADVSAADWAEWVLIVITLALSYGRVTHAHALTLTP